MQANADESNGSTQTVNEATESAYGSTVLDHCVEAVWAEIRDFNSYPAYINGVTESHLEDDRRGDEVGCVRRFVYNGNAIRQTLTGHCDEEHWFSHAGCEPLEWPFEGAIVLPVEYANLVQVRPVTDTNQAFVEWSLTFKCDDRGALKQWKGYFQMSIPVWLTSLRSYLANRREAGPVEKD